MFGKIEVSDIEYKLLLITTLLIPIYACLMTLDFASSEIYQYLFPPQKTFSNDSWEISPTFPLFRYLTFINLVVSSFLIYRRKILLSLFTFILPILGLIPAAMYIHWRMQKILETVNDAETIRYYSETSLGRLILSSLDNVNTIFLIFIATLAFWQITILFRFLIKNYKETLS